MGQRTSVYLDDSLRAAVKASAVPLAELIRLGAGDGQAAQSAAPGPARAILAALPDGEPSRGAICRTPSCWERNTSRYGLRQVPLCRACRAALEGRTHQRELPPGAERLRHGAA